MLDKPTAGWRALDRIIRGWRMNTLTLIGIVVIAIGTVLMVVGQKSDDDESSKALEKRIEEVRSELQVARSANDTAAIQSLQSEFDGWATSFLESKEQQRITVQRERLAATDSQLQISAAVRPRYSGIVADLRGVLNAYNGRATTPIEFHLPELPNNVFDAQDPTTYLGWIQFGPTLYWQVAVFPSGKIGGGKDGPGLWISLASGKKRLEIATGDFLLVEALTGGSLSITRFGERLPRSSDLEGAYNWTAERDKFRSRLAAYVGRQILEAENP
jgi:hypothetical protein